ncbi:MAG: hypothetical protein ABIL47_07025 [candidate division WOR-3 bacterium]
MNSPSFKEYKESLINYFKQHSQEFSDYNFEGSSLSHLLDILSYNYQQQMMYLSFAIKENYISDANLRKNVSKLAYNLGYIPQSATAAKLKVKFNIDFSDTPSYSNNYFILKSGTVISANTGVLTIMYSLENDYVVALNNDLKAEFEVELTEGLWITEEFILNRLNPVISINNPNTDLSTLQVTLEIDNELYPCYTRYGLKELNDKKFTFAIKETSYGTYELYFNNLSDLLENTQIKVKLKYIVCTGSLGSQVRDFRFVGRIVKATLNNDSILVEENLTINELRNSIFYTILDNPYGSSDPESIDSIRFNAPLLYGSQNRAVTKDDYKVIIKKLFPNYSSVRVFGGEEIKRPKYGKIFVTIKPKNDFFKLTNASKRFIKESLEEYTIAAATEVVVLDPLELKILLEIYCTYNSFKFNDTEENFKKLVFQALANYSFVEEKDDRYDEFSVSKLINYLYNSIDSLETVTIKPKMQRVVDLSEFNRSIVNFEICFSNEIAHNLETSTIFSNKIQLIEFPFPVYFKETNGNMVAYYQENEIEKVYSTLGTVNFKKGEVILNNVNISDKNSKLILTAIPEKDVIFSKNNMFITVSLNNISITASGISSSYKDLNRKKSALPPIYK